MKQSKNGIKKIDAFFTRVELGLLFLAGICLISMLLTVCIGVGSRAILGNSILWTNELASYLMLATVFLGAPWVLKNRAHIIVDIFTYKLKGRSLKINTIIVSIIAGAACAVYFWFSLTITLQHFTAGTIAMGSFPWPRFALYIPMVIGFFFLMIRFGIMCLNALFNIEDKSPAGESAAEAEKI